MFERLVITVKSAATAWLGKISGAIKRLTKPASTGVAFGAIGDAVRTRTEVVAESALLRHQLVVVRRSIKRRRSTTAIGSCWSCSPASKLTWGAERIRGELLELGVKVSKRTIRKYMRGVRDPRKPTQNWSTFLKNHASAIRISRFRPDVRRLVPPDLRVLHGRAPRAVRSCTST